MTNDFYDVDGNLIRSEPVDSAALQAENNASNLAYLTETDWYVTRKYETGKSIPQEILIKRQEARDAIA
jgi:hypothetical protein